MRKKIGYIRNRYPEKRNILYKASGENNYVRVGKARTLFLMMMRVFQLVMVRVFKKNHYTNWDMQAIYNIKSKKVDIVHTFNTTCKTNLPWICSFETAVPRTNQMTRRSHEKSRESADKITKKGFELLAKKNCSTLIALSESNKKIQIDLMEKFQVENRELISEKIVVIPPPQSVLITADEIEKKYKNVENCIEMLYVGRDFFCKGGAQMVDSISKLVDSCGRFHLTIVSSLNYGDPISRSTYADMEYYKNKINGLNCVTYYESLSNSEVLELCKKAHVGILPTLADTYGYSVLEMQACACPVITTDVRALSEINNNDCGFIFSVPKHPSTDAIYETAEELALLKNIITENIDAILYEILQHPEILKEKAMAAIKKIEREHSPEKYAEKLSLLYENAINSVD